MQVTPFVKSCTKARIYKTHIKTKKSGLLPLGKQAVVLYFSVSNSFVCMCVKR